MTDRPIRDAATIILLRDTNSGPSVLMGQRGAGAAFMPNKYVFPGGAVDAGDADVPLAAPLSNTTRAALAANSTTKPETLAAAALRELAEETGQIIAASGTGCPWPGFEGLCPDPSQLRFIFRAITPPGRPRRFDARFFLAPATALLTDPDDFSRAEDELGHLHWVPLAEARALDMPFITEVVLAETAAVAAGTDAPGTPFFDNSGETSVFHRL
ncbi:8-oxo-dGTP pyrophosphatase MutT, NUDIX family [Jannaschia faecimaris]|uniref:8-oxo-dGTP pyrophosphatase MutT, NUDIX family n=1 Tax=Jannaschia faecimaris TaxID=1244108 RepID=A0A1H3REA4_9RHOB|nr:NUDIX domain-containing protein [Jannaschia faecimaris]SDZ23893.1 8-oxo-dGTP pyrophosphatase MutT, NUDIX family [Jannaschia faecimaris]